MHCGRKKVFRDNLQVPKNGYNANLGCNYPSISLLPWLGERIEFSIKEGNEQELFSVDSSSGLLSLVQPLDYEEQDQVRFGVVSLTWSEQHLVLNNRDEKSWRQLLVSLNTLYITLAWPSSKPLFSYKHELLVRATVGDSSAEAAVLVRVTDQNDHAPVFPRTLHETQITEEDDRHLPKTILTVSKFFSLSLSISFPLALGIFSLKS